MGKKSIKIQYLEHELKNNENQKEKNDIYLSKRNSRSSLLDKKINKNTTISGKKNKKYNPYIKKKDSTK